MDVVKIKIESTRGFISAAIHNPESHTDKLAILCSGYLDTKDYKHLVRLAEKLANIGYVSLRFDPTGTWESSGDISDYNTTQYLDDIKTIINYMTEQQNFKQILIGGHSRGGMVSIIYAARDSRISLVLGIMPSNSRTGRKKMDEWKKAGFRISLRESLNSRDKQVEFSVPYSHAEDIVKYNVFEDVKKVKVPTILFAGELDDTVKPQDVEKIYQNANEPKNFIVLPNIGHDYRKNDNEIDIVNQIILEQL